MTVPSKINPKKQLARRDTKVSRCLFSYFFMLFWNGIVSVFLWQLIKGGAGGIGIFMGLFLIPFVLVGIGLIVLCGYCTLAVFTPNVTVTLSGHKIRVGDKISGKWSTTGGASRIQNLSIYVEGMEQARYRQGTRTYTDTSIFARIPIIDTKKPREIEKGSFEVEIPGDTMHSFKATNNEIVWSIVAKGEIPKWPDTNECFALDVLPVDRLLIAGGGNYD